MDFTQLFGIGSQIVGKLISGKADKKALNIQSDYTKHVGRFWDVVNSAIGNYPEITDADIPYLEQRLMPLAQKLDSNPYAYDGEGYYKARYGQALRDGATVSNFNVVIRSEIDNYLDQRGSNPVNSTLSTGLSLEQPSAFQQVNNILSQANQAIAQSAQSILGIKSSIETIKTGQTGATVPKPSTASIDWVKTALIGGGILVLVIFLTRKK